MSCKNYLLLIGILNTVMMSYNDPGFVTRIGKFEKDMEKCFREHEKHFGIKPDNSPRLAFNQLQTTFPSFKNIFMFISNGVRAEAENSSNEDLNLEEELYKYAVWLYLVGSDKDGVKYHNFCHGMFVAYITYEFLSKNTKLNGEPLKMPEGDKAMYVFAGLFHDAGHPGMGNGIYDIDKKHRENMIDHVIKNMEKILPNSSDKKEQKEQQQAKVELQNKINELKNKGENKFLLENMHRELALMVYNLVISKYVRPDNYVNPSKKIKVIETQRLQHSHFKQIISNSIDRTNMGFPFNSDQEHVLYRLNHAADLALNGMKDDKLVFLGIEKVYNEFFTEIYHMIRLKGDEGAAIKTFIQAGENGDQKKLPKSLQNFVPTAMPPSFNQIFQKQVGFCTNLILPHINHFNSYQADVFEYIKTNLVNNTKIFDQKIKNADGSELVTITANVMQQIKDEKEFNDPAIVSHLPYFKLSIASVPKNVANNKILLI